MQKSYIKREQIFGQSLLHLVVFQKRNYQVALKSRQDIGLEILLILQRISVAQLGVESGAPATP